MRRLLVLAALLVALVPLAARQSSADLIVINNGLAPPNPGNVIDAGDSYNLYDDVRVHNVGCPTVVEPCPMPWGDPTSVELVEGGEVWGLGAYESSTVTMSGGEVGDDRGFGGLWAYDSSSVTVGGGRVAGREGLRAYDSSTVTLSGGLMELLSASDSSTVMMSGGVALYGFFASGSSAVTISGGLVRYDLSAGDSSTVTLSGGSVEGDLYRRGLLSAYDSSSIRIVGTGFAVDGVPVGSGPIAATQGRLTGTLASGEPIDSDFLCDGGLITLIPEPAHALLVLTGVVVLAAARRQRA